MTRAYRFVAARAAALAAGVVGASLLAGCERASEGATPRANGDEVPALEMAVERPQPGDRDEAIRRAIEGRRLADAGRLERALHELEAAVAADPACVEARVELGFFLLEEAEETNYGGALLHFRVARLLAPEEPFAVCGEGLSRADLGDAARAEPLLRGSIDAMRPHATRFAIVTASLAGIAATRGRTDEAIAGFRAAADVPGIPRRARAIYLSKLADLLVEAHRPAEAEPRLREAIELDPENLRAHYLLTRVLAQRGATAEAAREARVHEALRALEDHRSKRHRQDVDRTLRLRRELNAAWPEYSRGAYALVGEMLEHARFKDALAELGELSRRDGATQEIHGLLARAKAGSGDLAGARDSLVAMTRAGPTVSPAFVRDVLDDWQRGNPGVTPEQMQATMREWLAQ